MYKLKEKEFLLIGHLRRNARESLTSISKKTKMPVSTIFDKLRNYENQFIRKHTALVDFAQLGYMVRANVLLKVTMEHRDLVKRYLLGHESVNSLFKVNNGFDFLAELVFHHLNELEEFIELLEQKFKIQDKNVFYIIEDICREEFMSKSELAVS